MHVTNASNIICFFCDGKGHYKSECPKRKEWERSERSKEKNDSENGKEAAGLVEEDSDDEYLGIFSSGVSVLRGCIYLPCFFHCRGDYFCSLHIYFHCARGDVLEFQMYIYEHTVNSSFHSSLA